MYLCPVPRPAEIEHGGGGAEFLYEHDYSGALNVETEVLMPENNLAYSVESFTPNPGATKEKHGVFWLPMRSAELFFAVYNSSDQTVTVQPELTYGGSAPGGHTSANTAVSTNDSGECGFRGVLQCDQFPSCTTNPSNGIKETPGTYHFNPE